MTKKIVYTIFHLEDEASNWRALPRAVRGALFELLSEDARKTLLYVPPADRTVYPSLYTLSWVRNEVQCELRYWLLESESVADVKGEIGREATFIIDVMRPDGDGILKSSLITSLNSIAQYVSDWGNQVRVFSAFGIPEADADKSRSVRLIKKGDTPNLINFILQRVGEVVPE